MATPVEPTSAGAKASVFTPMLARAAVFLVILLDIALEIRTFSDQRTSVDDVLDSLPLITNSLMLAAIVLGLRRARHIGFKHRARPLHLKAVFGLTLVSWALWLQYPHYKQTESFATDGVHHYVLTSGLPKTEVTAAAYWSRLHAHNRFEIAGDMVFVLVFLGMVEARIGPVTEDSEQGRRPG